MLFVALTWATGGFAGQRCRYRIELRDKVETQFSLARPEEFLSERAIERRRKQGLEIDSTDLPVCETYIKGLEAKGGRCVLTSRWNNAVLMETDDQSVADRWRTLPMVKRIEMVWKDAGIKSELEGDRKKELNNELVREGNYYGRAWAQIAMHKGDSLHRMGYKGRGMHIAVIDAGFYNADGMKALKKMHLLGIKDFVDAEADMFAEHNHGMKVLSCMAANAPRAMVGTAPEAAYLLLRTEEMETEQPAEEDAWTAAVEYADSMGVDVVNTSLGYYQYDDPFGKYMYDELDGKTSLMTRTASMMAQKGMLLVCSAGNTGDGSWKKITVPGDAKDVLTVGAVDKDSVNTVFSAVGNTADGRVKPDVMACGLEAAVLEVDGTVGQANGTSFASPIFCGLAACLWQACPWLNVYELMDIIRKAGNGFTAPNNIYGYGIVDIMKAYRMGMELKH